MRAVSQEKYCSYHASGFQELDFLRVVTWQGHIRCVCCKRKFYPFDCSCGIRIFALWENFSGTDPVSQQSVQMEHREMNTIIEREGREIVSISHSLSIDYSSFH